MLLWPVTFLSIGFWMHATVSIPYVFTLAVGKPQIAARSAYYALFVVLPVTCWLVYRFGIAGAGFSWIFYHLFTYAYFVPRACSQCLNMPAWRWYVHVLKVFGLAGLTYGGTWAVIVLVGPSTLLSLILGYTFASVTYGAAAYRLLGKEVRETLRRMSFLKPAPASTLI
jgi:hypothetical protein